MPDFYLTTQGEKEPFAYMEAIPGEAVTSRGGILSAKPVENKPNEVLIALMSIKLPLGRRVCGQKGCELPDMPYSTQEPKRISLSDKRKVGSMIMAGKFTLTVNARDNDLRDKILTD